MRTASGNVGKHLQRLGLIAIAMLALKTMAAETSTNENFRRVERADGIIGMAVKDTRNQGVGKVYDLALDLENGRIVEVIVSSGGFLGLGQKIVAVPPGALRLDPAELALRINVDKEKFKAAPGFTMSEWTEHCQSSRVAEGYRYYGQEPYFAADGQGSKSGNTATEPLGHIERASRLLNLPIRNLQDAWLGTVNAFAYDLQSGRILHVIVQSPGFLKTRSVIPARALRFNAARDALSFDVSAQAFKDEPQFRWTSGTGGNFQQETYSNTKVAANDGVNTKQNVREGTAGSYTPLAQGANNIDVEKTSRIYAAMRADAGLSRNAQNVEVGTLNNRTTLRGHVNTDEDKRIIGEIAAKAGLPENVSNQLEVRPLPAK